MRRAAILAFFLGPLAWQALTSLWPEAELTRPLVSHLVRGQPTQFFIDQRQQFVGGLQIAVVDGVKDACDLTHNSKVNSKLFGISRHKSDPDGRCYCDFAIEFPVENR